LRDLVHGLTHFDRGVARYDPEQHRPLATRFGADIRVSNVSFRSWAQWMRGYPEAALADANQALQEARDISQATPLLFALFWTSLIQFFCGNFATATREHDELITLADEKGSFH
jgi:predicted ATPase